MVVILITRDLQVDLVKHVLSLSTAQLGVRSRGDLLTRLTADLGGAVTGVVAPVTASLFSLSIRLVLYLALALFVAPKLCGVLVVLALAVRLAQISSSKWPCDLTATRTES